MQPRVESGVGSRDHSAKPKEPTSIKSDTEDWELQGKRKPMHQPLQNHDNDYLSNFITQMYQTTTQH